MWTFLEGGKGKSWGNNAYLEKNTWGLKGPNILRKVFDHIEK